MDKFPEAFQRFEIVVETDKIRSFNELKASFRIWSGRNWKGSPKQVKALKREARRLGIPIPLEKPRVRRPLLLRPFARRYRGFQHWKAKSPSKGAYRRRIERYMLKHPKATLSEARGHRKK